MDKIVYLVNKEDISMTGATNNMEVKQEETIFLYGHQPNHL